MFTLEFYLAVIFLITDSVQCNDFHSNWWWQFVRWSSLSTLLYILFRCYLCVCYFSSKFAYDNILVLQYYLDTQYHHLFIHNRYIHHYVFLCFLTPVFFFFFCGKSFYYPIILEQNIIFFSFYYHIWFWNRMSFLFWSPDLYMKAT